MLGLPGLARRGLLRRRRSACGRSNPGLRGRVEAVHLERVLADDGLLGDTSRELTVASDTESGGCDGRGCAVGVDEC